MASRLVVNDNAIGPTMALKYFAEQTLCCRQVTMFAEQAPNDVANAVDGAIAANGYAACTDSEIPY